MKKIVSIQAQVVASRKRKRSNNQETKGETTKREKKDLRILAWQQALDQLEPMHPIQTQPDLDIEQYRANPT
jgi:hypothetical protein